MKRIGFAIYTVQGGSGEPWIPEANRGTWSAGIRDLRTWLDYWQIGDGEHLKFIKFDKDGMFYVSVSPITSGRPGDFSSYWIYIPNSIEVTGKEIVELIYDVENSGKDANRLRDLFGKEYNEKEHSTKNHIENGQDSFAYRRYDSDEDLAVLLGENRYQPYYAKYKAIFLLDANSNISARAQLADLTNKKISEVLIVFPPTSSDVVKIFGNHHVSITFQGKTFDNGIKVQKGASISITAEREGFEPIQCSMEECGNYKPGIISLEEGEASWKKKINKGFFVISDGQKNITNCKIKLNEKKLTEGYIILTEDECENCDVSIVDNAGCYSPFEETINISKYNSYPITLTHKDFSAEYPILLRNGKQGIMSITTKSKIKENESPLTAYEWGAQNILCIDWWFVWKNRLYGFLLALVSFFIVFGGSALLDQCESFSFIEKKKEKKADTKEAIKYLDENTIWDREFMDKFECLDGLYDDMNNFNIRSLAEKWNYRLSDSKTFQKIYNTITEETQKNVTSPYGRDNTINVVDYIKKLEELSKPRGLTEAIHYLDEHKIWNKTEMENFTELHGLFDALNDFNFEKIKSYKSLKSSNTFKKLASAVKRCQQKSWNPKQGDHNPTYNKRCDDYDIVIRGYIFWISEDRSKSLAGGTGGARTIGSSSGSSSTPHIGSGSRDDDI